MLPRLAPLLALAPLAAASRDPRPNIIFLLADDLGYADTGFQGAKDIPTPHLDALAQAGVRCTRGYVSAPVCSPSRAGLLTGRHQARFGHQNNLVAAAALPHAHLPLAETTLADALGAAGYRTALVGKWHLGLQDYSHPNRRGFAHFFGMTNGGHDYFKNDPALRATGDADYTARIERNGTGVPVSGYLTDAFADEAVRLIRETKDKPLFLYLAFNAPHSPAQAPAALTAAMPDSRQGKKRRTYAAQIAAMDTAIGKVRAALRETGADQNTLLVFLSDNGGATGGYFDNTPLRAHKGTLYEGGIRVPFLVAFPGKIPAGTRCDLPVSALDLFATACAAAGVTPKSRAPLDSRDLLPVLSGAARQPVHDALFWDFPRFGTAMTEGDLKLVVPNDGAPELYDLAADLAETKNLAATRPADLARLTRRLADWRATTVKPLWNEDRGPAPKK